MDYKIPTKNYFYSKKKTKKQIYKTLVIFYDSNKSIKNTFYCSLTLVKYFRSIRKRPLFTFVFRVSNYSNGTLYSLLRSITTLFTSPHLVKCWTVPIFPDNCAVLRVPLQNESDIKHKTN